MGWLQLTLALGSQQQINYFNLIQQEREKAREMEEEERRRMDRRNKKKNLEDSPDNARDKKMEELLRELIDTIKDKSSNTTKRQKGKWEDNYLDSLHKLFEECRLENTKDLKLKVFTSATSKENFESDLLDNTTLNRKSVQNIVNLWNFDEGFTLEQLQESYNTY